MRQKTSKKRTQKKTKKEAIKKWKGGYGKGDQKKTIRNNHEIAHKNVKRDTKIDSIRAEKAREKQ